MSEFDNDVEDDDFDASTDAILENQSLFKPKPKVKTYPVGTYAPYKPSQWDSYDGYGGGGYGTVYREDKEETATVADYYIKRFESYPEKIYEISSETAPVIEEVVRRLLLR